jgi:hypothetical protein
MAINDTVISGSAVERLTNVAPIIIGLMPDIFESIKQASINRSPPFTINNTPNINSKMTKTKCINRLSF